MPAVGEPAAPMDAKGFYWPPASAFLGWFGFVGGGGQAQGQGGATEGGAMVQEGRDTMATTELPAHPCDWDLGKVPQKLTLVPEPEASPKTDQPTGSESSSPAQAGQGPATAPCEWSEPSTYTDGSRSTSDAESRVWEAESPRPEGKRVNWALSSTDSETDPETARPPLPGPQGEAESEADWAPSACPTPAANFTAAELESVADIPPSTGFDDNYGSFESFPGRVPVSEYSAHVPPSPLRGIHGERAQEEGGDDDLSVDTFSDGSGTVSPCPPPVSLRPNPMVYRRSKSAAEGAAAAQRRPAYQKRFGMSMEEVKRAEAILELGVTEHDLQNVGRMLHGLPANGAVFRAKGLSRMTSRCTNSTEASTLVMEHMMDGLDDPSLFSPSPSTAAPASEKAGGDGQPAAGGKHAVGRTRAPWDGTGAGAAAPVPAAAALAPPPPGPGKGRLRRSLGEHNLINNLESFIVETGNDAQREQVWKEYLSGPTSVWGPSPRPVQPTPSARVKGWLSKSRLSAARSAAGWGHNGSRRGGGGGGGRAVAGIGPASKAAAGVDVENQAGVKAATEVAAQPAAAAAAAAAEPAPSKWGSCGTYHKVGGVLGVVLVVLSVVLVMASTGGGGGTGGGGAAAAGSGGAGGGRRLRTGGMWAPVPPGMTARLPVLRVAEEGSADEPPAWEITRRDDAAAWELMQQIS